jgi:alpha-N-arabinofuranosidase
MVLTPTYHVFEMYKPFMDTERLPLTMESPWYHKDGASLRALNAAAVKDANGKVHIGLVNADPSQSLQVRAALNGLSAKKVTGRVLTATAMDARNTFEQPNAVAPSNFNGAKLSGNNLEVVLPAKSVVMLTVE